MPPSKNNSSVATLEHHISVLNKRFWSVIALLVGVTLFNAAFLISLQRDLLENDRDTTSISQLAIQTTATKNYKVAINSFFNNAAISEVAYQLELKRQSISTKNTTNCFTPEIPPLSNGCSFVVRPYASGISSKGTKLLQLRLAAQMSGDDKIAIDIRDVEKNEITSSVGIIQGKLSDRVIPLPAQLGSKEQLLVRLWPATGGVVTINEVVLEYISFDHLQPLAVELPSSYPGLTLSIYRDVDNNKKLEKTVDKLLSCTDNFPGVRPTTLTTETTVQLQRDDSCVTQYSPSTWSADNGKNAIAPYSWLAVIQGVDGAVSMVYPFEVKQDSNTVVLQ